MGETKLTKGDGGISWVRAIFAPRVVTRLDVPGFGADGFWHIVVGFEDGGSIDFAGINVSAAWQAVADEAERAGREALRKTS